MPTPLTFTEIFMDSKRMNQVTLLSRLLIAMLFILAGLGKLMGFAGASAMVAKAGLPMADIVTGLVIAIELGGGIALAVGCHTKWAAYALAAFTLLASLLVHNFWTMEGGAAMLNQIMFLKNLAIIGGLLLFAIYGPGSYACTCKSCKKAAA
jgi:putative oxidoreductase